MTIGRYKGKDYSMGFRTGHFYLISINYDANNGWIWVREWPGRRFCPYATMEKLKENWDINKKAAESAKKATKKAHYYKSEVRC